MEKALAVLYSPKSLLDFLWYYEAYGKKKYEYDLLIVPAGMDAEGKWTVRIYDQAVKSYVSIAPSPPPKVYAKKSFARSTLSPLQFAVM